MESQDDQQIDKMQLVKIHDRFSLEIKLGLVPSLKTTTTKFSLNAWIFIPKSLDINSSTYSKPDFYRDLKSNIRLITPDFTLEEIVHATHSPLSELNSAVIEFSSQESRSRHIDIEHHTRLFLSILKSALRDEVNRIRDTKNEAAITGKIDQYISATRMITVKYRGLRSVLAKPSTRQRVPDYFAFGDEFMSNLLEHRTFKLIQLISEKGINLPDDLRGRLTDLIEKERSYKRKMGFPVVEKDAPDRNRKLLARLGVLKKFMVSDLFLNTVKRREGVLIEQIYFSLAAGISMIFATVIAFSFQQKYGNYTMPFFVALVISYMLKDRIKDLVRHYFAHRLGGLYFDHKTSINMKGIRIGTDREAVDFITHDKVPEEVISLRSRTSVFDEYARQLADSILLFRKVIRIKRESLDRISHYHIPGIHEIIRLNVMNFCPKMDNPDIPLYIPDGGKGYELISGEKVYYLNLVIRIRYLGKDDYVHYRLVMNRNGLLNVEKIRN